MKMSRGRNVEIAMAVYIAVGLALIHRTLYGLIFSVFSGLLCFAIIMRSWESGQEFEKYDSWGWSKATTKGVFVWAIILFVGGVPLWRILIYWYVGVYGVLTIPYWEMGMVISFGGMMGLAVHFRGYLKPLEGETTNPEVLKLEHAEWVGLFRSGGILAAALFLATAGSYLSGWIREKPLPHGTILIYVLQLFYIAAGYSVWLLRCFHGRCKEIRDHLNRLERRGNSLKEPGAKNET